MVSCHVGLGPCLVDEDEPVGIEVELAVEPVPAALQDVGTVLLRGMDGLFFARDRVALEEPADGAVAEDEPDASQPAPQFLQGDVRHLGQQCQDRRLVRLDAAGSAIPAKRPGPGIAVLALQRPPATDARRADPEPLPGLTVRQARRDRRNNPYPKINRQRFRHACRPPPGKQCESDQR